MHLRSMKSLIVGLVGILLFVNAPVMADSKFDAMFAEDQPLKLEDTHESTISDPLEPINRAFFAFNDKLYFWVLKPISTAYAAVLAEDVRVCVRNAFSNLLAPVRIVNNLLQGKIGDAGIEVVRTVINSTVGVVGLGDPAASEFNIRPKEEDLGQTLGRYGFGNGIYICWPLFGPSTLRDTLGMIGDGFLNPVNYINEDFIGSVAVSSGNRVNDVSLRLGEYEDFKQAALDPYVSLRDAYYQYRKARIEDRDEMKPALSDAQKEDATHESNPPVLRLEAPGKCFFIHIGTCIDEAQVAVFSKRLEALSRSAVVRVYERNDYRFYGIETPVTGTFSVAKKQEVELASLGFTSAILVVR